METLQNNQPLAEERKVFGLNSLALKIIAVLLMTLDHIGLLFFTRGSGRDINTDYYVLRAIGKMAFPLFAFLAVEGIYHTRDAKNYMLRLAIGAILIDLVGYIFSWSRYITIASNPLIGNVFTDMFMGVVMIYLLRKKNWWSLFAILPIAYEFLSRVTINDSYGTLFKSDWGAFSIVMFFCLFLAREIGDYYLKSKARKAGVEEEAYLLQDGLKNHKYSEAIAILFVELCFYLVYRLDNFSMFLPNEFVPIGTFSTLAALIVLFYNGKKGYSNKVIQYSFYAYYPAHILILGIISMYVGQLALQGF